MNFLSRFRLPSFDDMASAIRRRFEEFDFDSVETRLSQFGDDMEKSFTKLKKRIKNLTDKFVVEVPFNKDTQKISFSFEGNVMEVKTETHTDTTHSVSTTSATIPNDVNTDTLIQKYDEENKKMQFIFFKWGRPITEEETDGEVDMETNEEESIDEQENIFEVETEENTTTMSVTQDTTPTFETTTTTITNDKDALLETIMRMYAEGHSYRKIAAEVGVSDKTVARWIKKVLAEIEKQD